MKGETYVVADCLSRNHQVISTKWTLNQAVRNDMWKVWGCPLVDLFTTRFNFRPPSFHSPFHGPVAIDMDAFLYQWDFMEVYVSQLFHVIKKVLNKFAAQKGSSSSLYSSFGRKEGSPT